MRCFKQTFLLFFVFIVSNTYGQSIGGTTSGAVTYCTNSNSGIVTVTGYVGTILNWQSSTDGGIIWNNNINTSANQTYFNLNQTTCYRAIVKDGVFAPDTSTIVCITIYPQSLGGTISGGGTYCDSSGAGTLTLSGYAGNLLYWQSSTDDGLTWSTIVNTTVTENYSNITQNTIYHAVVQNNPACPTDTSTQAIFNVYPVTVAGTIIGADTVCAGANSGTLTLLGYTGAILGWESSINNGSSWSPITNSTATQGYLNLSQATWYRAIIQSGICSSDTSANFIIDVSPPTVAGIIGGGGIYCTGSATGTLTLAGYTGIIIGWASSVTNGLTWNSIVNTTTSQAYNGLSQTTWYSAIVQSGTCNMDSTTAAIITVGPASVVNAGNDIIITSNQSVTLNGTGAGNPLWTPAAGLSNPTVFFPSANPDSTTTYILTVTDSNGCISSDTVMITVIQNNYNGKVSNYFSPNGDGINDNWFVEGIENFPDNEVFIYNIYGKEVYSKKGYTSDWQGTFNGTELPDGTYYYVIKFGKLLICFRHVKK